MKLMLAEFKNGKIMAFIKPNFLKFTSIVDFDTFPHVSAPFSDNLFHIFCTSKICI